VEKAVNFYRDTPELRELTSAQWGAIRALLATHGAGKELRKHFAHQREKARADAPAFAALERAMKQAEQTGSELEETVSTLTLRWGAEFSGEDFRELVKRMAAVRFFGALIRAAAVREMEGCTQN